MKTSLLSTLCLLSLFSSISPVKADTLSDFKDSLTALNNSFSVRYAGAEYIKALYGWSGDATMSALIAKAEANPNLSVEDAQRLIQDYVDSTRDYHAQAFFGGRAYVHLSFGVQSAEGRVFVTYIDANHEHGQIRVGQELLTFDGVPAMTAIKNLQVKTENSADTDLRDATRRLTDRYGMLMDPLPVNPSVSVTLKKRNGTTFTQTLAWILPLPAATPAPTTVPTATPVPTVTPAPTPIIDNPFGYSSRKSYFPKPKTVTWEAADSDFFYAWTGVTTHGKRVGLIRIPTFDLSSEAAYGKAMEAYSSLLAKMNAETDELVIDLQGNRGGFLDYGYALISHLIDQPVPSLNFQYRLYPALLVTANREVPKLAAITTQAQAETYMGGKTYGGYPVNLAFITDLKAMYQGWIDDAAAGLTLGTPRPYDAAHILPAEGTRYTKKLFVAIDSWSGSCGDMFPALLQDLHRATVIGTRSEGAGAMAGSAQKMPVNSIKFGSVVVPLAIARRLDGSYIENVGAVPNIRIAPTARDLKDGSYKDLRKNVERVLEAE